jgi:hypothetical protein
MSEKKRRPRKQPAVGGRSRSGAATEALVYRHFMCGKRTGVRLLCYGQPVPGVLA